MPKVWTTTAPIVRAPEPREGGPRAASLTVDPCPCARCVAKRRYVTIRVQVANKLDTNVPIGDAVRYADAYLARELQTLDSLYAQSVRNLTLYGEEYLPVHMQVLDHITPQAPITRSNRLDPSWSKPFDRTAIREMRRDATEAVTRARLDTGPTDRLPRKARQMFTVNGRPKELAQGIAGRPTFYPSKDTGNQAGFESAATWQTLSQATNRARSTGELNVTPDTESQWDGLATLLGLADTVAAHKADVAELASAVRRMGPLPVYLDRVYDRLGHTARKKLTRLLK